MPLSTACLRVIEQQATRVNENTTRCDEIRAQTHPNFVTNNSHSHETHPSPRDMTIETSNGHTETPYKIDTSEREELDAVLARLHVRPRARCSSNA